MPTPAAGEVQAAQPLHAARDASEFVARMFSDIGSADAVAVEAPSSEAAAQSEAAEVPTELPTMAPAEAVQGLLAGRSVLVLGLGISGMSMARWCVRCGAAVTVADTRAEPPLLARLRGELPQVRFVGGAFDAALVAGKGLHAVLRSPGLSPAEIAPVIVAANADGISAEGELGLYSDALAALRSACGYAPRVLAVTGTNGKTTVTALTGLLAAEGGARVAVAGNIGPALLDTLAQHLDSGTLPEVWVLELSSFQLDAPANFEPTAAAVLNISQDHLDWHGSMQAYAAAKARVFGKQGLMVLNRDDPVVMQMHAAASAAAVPEGGARGKQAKVVQREIVTFGADSPKRPGDFGIELVHGMAWLVRAQEADETRKRAPRRSSAGQGAEPDEIFIQRLIPTDALRIRGRHNAVNALAALALAQAAGGALGPMLYALRDYRGEPHRVEPVGTLDGIEYFDDSKGTNVGATVAAISGLGAERRVVVILGGVGKGQDFSPLAVPVERFARAVVLIGRDAPQIRAALESTGVPLLDASTLAEAVDLATRRAHAGDAVLLSPACASFDMFEHYVQRGEMFAALVRERAQDAGHPWEGAA
ncbi:UDP-N-acetylmuramoyl-L-alanine--D-glutamate ligase [Simplicispira hankyongi]|uniref:UDP-N-acetylmuramoylalanine--D-glutamate ligase n=2 Tax=Simplicispira hankyongi TaxID=2315688 RepID=A0A398C919_9BURK|nr:UDP-N-acetylmuramoyl-L-alanine--D-glutamate ligase [Simplicispira hankyongi]RID98834.1 UDP-N-acetylmuramoyl-L-alanine--D-glutamate ligase [Simplicispira hankyongi]